ncbi:MAG TPA: group I intron-associated PD-(D/E)XK endonuclease [Acidimicrobiales bacterium]|nr:group I intron-associated PD-(D/E)XK endonuclease [Acidimicrobiales bacterium]
MGHHTKDKGDLGVAKAHADLIEQGYLVLFPMTEHAPFDLVAYKTGTFVRVQVKYRSLRHGTVKVNFRATWSDGSGYHSRAIDKSQIDVVCIYCPNTGECYYVRPMAHGVCVALRVTASRNNQVKGVQDAAAFRRLQAAEFTPARAPAST